MPDDLPDCLAVQAALRNRTASLFSKIGVLLYIWAKIGYNHRHMSFMLPFYLALRPDDKILYRAFILTDEPGIPDDTYQLQEWYCPNPGCHCNEVYLHVLANQQSIQALRIHLPLEPQQPTNLTWEPDEEDPVYAGKLFKLIANNITSDPDFVQRLRDHYHIVKSVAADPSHPCHTVVTEWAKTGRRPPEPGSQKRKRKKR